VRDSFGLLPTVKSARSDVTGDHAGDAQYGTLSDSESLPRGCRDDATCPDEDILFDHDPTGSPSMRNESGTQADLHSVMDFNTFRVFVFKVDVISNEDLPANLNPSETVEKWTKCGCSRQKPCKLV